MNLKLCISGILAAGWLTLVTVVASHELSNNYEILEYIFITEFIILFSLCNIPIRLTEYIEERLS